MNRLALRTWVAEVTGRYDLVDSDFTDNGIDKYVTQAQRFLDRLFNFPKGFASVFEGVAAGVWYAKFTNNRSIKRVWANTSTTRVELEKKDRVWLMNQYNSLISATDSDAPLYWAPAELRTMDSTDKDSLGTFFRYIVADDETYNGVIILPAPEEAMVLEVYGQFYTDDFGGDTPEADETWWSSQHPEVLVWATAYLLEVSYRNREGARDWLEAIKEHARQIDFDTIETEIAQIDQVNG